MFENKCDQIMTFKLTTVTKTKMIINNKLD